MRGRVCAPTGCGEVTQTILATDDYDNEPVGNCFQAAVASLFDLPLGIVPNFVQLDEDGVGHYFAMLGQWSGARGWHAIRRDDPAWLDKFPDTPCLVYGRSPRTLHIVVRRADGSIWDPHPSRSGLVEIRGAIDFVRA